MDRRTIRTSTSPRGFRLGTCLFLLAIGVYGLSAVPRVADARTNEIDRLLKDIATHAREPFKQRERLKSMRAIAKLGTPEAAKALLELMDDPYEHIHDHVVSAWIRMAGGKRKGEAARARDVRTWMWKKGLAHKEPHVRCGLVTALGLAGRRDFFDAMRARFPKEKHPAVLTTWARMALRLSGSWDAKAPRFSDRIGKKAGVANFWLARAAGKVEEPETVTAILRGHLQSAVHPLAQAGAVRGLELCDGLSKNDVAKALASPHEEVRIALADVFPCRLECLTWPGAGMPVLVSLLSDTSWRVRSAAILAALRVWQPDVVPLLIARLGAETGRLSDDAQRALETISGKALGDDPDLWQAWWNAQKDRLELDARPEIDRHGRIAFRDPRERGKSNKMGGSVSFFDVPLRSKQLVFVFDLSGSMRDAASKRDARTKLDVLREEFAKTLEAFDKDVAFDVFVYRYPSDHPPKAKLTRALGKIRPASGANKKKALGWLRKQEAVGWGAFVEPLEAAIHEEVDTVILLSDGRPSRGRLDRDFRILQEFPALNRFRQVHINTVLIGEKGADKKFMTALAKATGGRSRSSSESEK